MTHPVTELFEWFPEFDFAVLEHGFAPHGRDYSIVAEINGHTNKGRYQLTFTHVVELAIRTNVRDDVWPVSWDDTFIDYQRWEQAGAPNGYVWGSNWSLAYPGLSVVEPSEKGERWTSRIGAPMFEVSLETDRFHLSFVFHSLRTQKIDDRTSLLSKVFIPFASPPGGA